MIAILQWIDINIWKKSCIHPKIALIVGSFNVSLYQSNLAVVFLSQTLHCWNDIIYILIHQMFHHHFYLICNLQEIFTVKGFFPHEINISHLSVSPSFGAALFVPMVFVVSQPVRGCIAGKTSITEISNASTMRWKGAALLV